MNRMDVRTKTGIIVKRGSEFLVARQIGTGVMKWSNSPYDAWITRNRETAKRIAQRLGGDLFLFNPVVGQMREMTL